MNKSCPECGAKLSRETRSVSYTYKGHHIEISQPGEWCPACNEGVLSRDDMKATEKALHDFKARIDGLLTSDEVREIRKRIALSQKAAAEIFGGGPNAFSRYERGEAMQMKAVDTLLRLLDKHKELVTEVKAMMPAGGSSSHIEGSGKDRRVV